MRFKTLRCLLIFLFLFSVLSSFVEQAESISLYQDCANTLSIGDIFKKYNQGRGELPVVKQWWVEGAVKVHIPDDFRLVLEPKRNGTGFTSVQAKLKDGSIVKGKFAIKLAPPPSIYFLNKGKMVKDTLDFETYKSELLVIKLSPDQEFREFFPQDARYKLQDAKLVIRKGGEEVFSEILQKYQLDLSSLKLEKGSTLEITFDKVLRSNYRGDVYPVTNMPNKPYQIHFK